MSRLTELIDIDGMKIKTSKERPLSNQGLGAILHKLYALENLEDELGYSILDVFKALKEGIKIDFGEQIMPPKLYYDDVYNKWKFKIDYYSTAVGLYDVKDVINGINVESDK